MEDKTKQCPRTTQYPSSAARGTMDFLQEVSDPGEILLDSLIYQRPEGEEEPYQTRGQAVSSANSELDKVLDCILSSSASGGSTLWTGSVTPVIHGMSVTSATTGKTLEDPRTDTEVWNETTDSTKDRSTLEDCSGNRTPRTTGVPATLTSRHLNFTDMSVLPVYLSTQERHLVGTDGSDSRGSNAGSSQQLSLFPKQSSCLHPDTEPVGKVKLEESEVSLFATPKENTLCPDYGLPHPTTTTSDANQFLDFISCKTESSAVYEPFTTSPGNSDENPTSSSPQSLYQPLNLNGHQLPACRSLGVKEPYLSQILLPYVQYIRSDEPGQTSPYTFDSLQQKTCLICGDEASGCHYGVLTCGSCKVFFKRAIEGQHNYLCAGRNDCIVDKIRRKNCPSCRLRKCCQAGMVLGGRKFKKFNKMKPGREIGTFVIQQSTSAECQQALTRRTSASSAQEIQYIPELLQILQSIEPEMVYAGYDNTQPETPSALLCSLNQLCERQLLCVVKWSKSLPGFRNLHIDDQIILLQYSWMSLMAFAMGWRSYKHVSGQMLYFAPDLVLNEQRMKDSSFYSLCLSMRQLPQEFVRLQITQEEFLCMKALLLLNTIPLEGLKSQSLFDEMRSNYIRELAKVVGMRHKGVVASSQRFFHLTKVMDSMHELVKQLHLYCLNTFLQSRALSVEFPEMMTEVISAQLPKILAGMVKQLVFHQK
ncbi:progesterone receptor [Pseudophryne corroboree]|uniref:progesterone receptor n=1 Tax=Pseudophryne corroboree TaxID=495146 RepID=UPI003081C7CA